MREYVDDFIQYIQDFAAEHGYNTSITETADTLFVNIDLGNTDGQLSVPVEFDWQFPIEQYDNTVDGKGSFTEAMKWYAENRDVADYLQQFQTEENEERFGGGNLAELLRDAITDVADVLKAAAQNAHVFEVAEMVARSNQIGFFMNQETGDVLGVSAYHEKPNAENPNRDGLVFHCIHYNEHGEEQDWAGDWFNLYGISDFDVDTAKVLGVYDSVEDCYKKHGEEISNRANRFSVIDGIDISGITPGTGMSYPSEYPCYLNDSGSIIMIEINEVMDYSEEECKEIGNPGLEYGGIIYDYDNGYHCDEYNDCSGTSIKPNWVTQYCGKPMADLGRHKNVEECIKANAELLQENGYKPINLDAVQKDKSQDER